MSASINRVLITGASSGIGFDLARRFLAEGSRVAMNARDPEKLERARRTLDGGERLVAVPGNISTVQVAQRVVKQAAEAMGGLDVLVNNAGIFASKPFLDTSEAEFDALVATNLKGTYFVTQAAVPYLQAAGGGSITNVGTVLVSQGKTRLPVSAAMASKGGVHALTVSWAAELAQYKIRVNTLAPGIVRTPLVGEQADSFADIAPLGRIGEVSETSDAVLYLSRAGFVTGSVLPVDGGYAHGR